MTRDYKSESAWAKSRYKRIEVKLLPEEYQKLKALLDQRNLSVSAWVREKIASDHREVERDNS